MRSSYGHSPELVARVVAMYAAGEKCAVIEVETGVSDDSITKYARLAGVTLRSNKCKIPRLGSKRRSRIDTLREP